MKTAHLFFCVAAGAVGVGVVAGVRVAASISALCAATSPASSSSFSVADVEGLFLALPKPDGVDVGVVVVAFEG